MSIINNRSTSFNDIENNIIEYLKTLENWNDIKDALPGSNLTIITNLLAGYASYLGFKNRMMRDETYLSTAKLSTSVYNIAKVFGYSINRYSAPSLNLRYEGYDTITVRSGDTFGTYNNLDLVYFGANDILEHGEVINCETNINPFSLVSIDNKHITVKINDVKKDISKLIEDYIVYNKIVEYSNDIYSTKLMISDTTNRYGVVVSSGDILDIEYLETNGYEEALNVKNVSVNNNWSAIEITHLGSNGDTLNKIKNLAPLYYSTMRRMVTENDHRYIIEAHPYIKSAFAEREKGTPYEVTLSLDESGVNNGGIYSFNLGSFYYAYTSPVGGNDTINDIANNLYTKLLRNNTITATLNNNKIVITSKNARFDNYLKYINESEVESYVRYDVITKGIKPQCCTVNVWYIKYDTINDPKALTFHEQDEISAYIEQFKLVGIRVILSPADVIYKDINIKIKLSENYLYDEVYKKFIEILNNYELKLNTGFKYGDLLAEIANIKVIKNDIQINPVISIIPNQTVFDVLPQNDKYIKFRNVSLLNE